MRGASDTTTNRFGDAADLAEKGFLAAGRDLVIALALVAFLSSSTGTSGGQGVATTTVEQVTVTQSVMIRVPARRSHRANQRARTDPPPMPVFRDRKGRAGLLYPRCMHRGTSLYYGRVEQDGLRCCYHGWLFDVEGRCLDQPCEPDHGRHRDSA